MIDAVRNLVALGASMESALAAATMLPARIAGRPELGTLAPGTTADVLVLDDSLELRRVLEPPIARYSAERRSSADIERLAGILVRLEASLTDVPRWIEADLDFHEAIAASAGNRLLDLQIRALRPVIREVMELFNSRSTRTAADWRKTYKRHVQVVDAIRAGDAEAAQRAMSKHFEAAEAAIAELATIREEEIHGNRDRAGP